MTKAASLALALATYALSSCQAPPPSPAAAQPAPEVSQAGKDSAESRGLHFARNRCADCHGVETGVLSPNPSAPEFAAVANTPGLTRESLANWFATSHDFPQEMYFAIPDEKIGDLVAYVLTLRSEAYRPAVR